MRREGAAGERTAIVRGGRASAQFHGGGSRVQRDAGGGPPPVEGAGGLPRREAVPAPGPRPGADRGGSACDARRHRRPGCVRAGPRGPARGRGAAPADGQRRAVVRRQVAGAATGGFPPACAGHGDPSRHERAAERVRGRRRRRRDPLRPRRLSGPAGRAPRGPGGVPRVQPLADRARPGPGYTRRAGTPYPDPRRLGPRRPVRAGLAEVAAQRRCTGGRSGRGPVSASRAWPSRPRWRATAWPSAARSWWRTT